jgi:hypothetical protein
MIFKIISIPVVGATLMLLAPVSVHAVDADPLFADDSVLEVTITAPFKQIMKERSDEEYVEATLQYMTADGVSDSLNIGIRTRGEFRMRGDVCRFAPLRINFKKKQLDETVFDKQDKLKLVTHCQRNSERYEQSVISEYLAYRVLNLMTNASFRVRLMRLTYIYSDDKNKAEEQYAFFIEHKDRLAKRLEMVEIEVSQTDPQSIQPEYGSLVSVFHYLIGNTDFSSIAARPGSLCCHNHVLFGADDPPFWSIPYDFDQAGFVNAPYATTNPRFKLRSNRDRLYRGRCINLQILPDTLALYRGKRDEIEALINTQAELEKSTRSTMLTFVKSFYKLLDSEKRIESQLVKACI